jgi:hypothetical protein
MVNGLQHPDIFDSKSGHNPIDKIYALNPFQFAKEEIPSLRSRPSGVLATPLVTLRETYVFDKSSTTIFLPVTQVGLRIKCYNVYDLRRANFYLLHLNSNAISYKFLNVVPWI